MQYVQRYNSNLKLLSLQITFCKCTVNNITAVQSKCELCNLVKIMTLKPHTDSLLQRLNYVHHLQATSISCTFLVANYWSNTTTLITLQVTWTIQWSAHIATGLLHCSISCASTALLMATVLLLSTDWCLSTALRGVISSYTIQMETAIAHWSSAHANHGIALYSSWLVLFIILPLHRFNQLASQ